MFGSRFTVITSIWNYISKLESFLLNTPEDSLKKNIKQSRNKKNNRENSFKNIMYNRKQMHCNKLEKK